MSFISVLKVRQKKALLDTDSGWKKTILLWVTTSKQRLNVRLNGRWGRCRLFLHIEEVSGGNSSLAEKRRTSLTHTSRYIHTSTHANTHQQADGRFRRCSARQHQAGLYLRTQRDTVSFIIKLQGTNMKWCKLLCCLWCSPSSSSRLAPPPVLTWLTLSSVFHLAQQVAVSPPPGHKWRYRI